MKRIATILLLIGIGFPSVGSLSYGGTGGTKPPPKPPDLWPSCCKNKGGSAGTATELVEVILGVLSVIP